MATVDRADYVCCHTNGLFSNVLFLHKVCGWDTLVVVYPAVEAYTAFTISLTGSYTKTVVADRPEWFLLRLAKISKESRPKNLQGSRRKLELILHRRHL